MDLNSEIHAIRTDAALLAQLLEQATHQVLGIDGYDAMAAWMEPRLAAVRTDIKQLHTAIRGLLWAAAEHKRTAERAVSLPVSALLAAHETPLAIDPPMALAVEATGVRRR